METWFVHCEYPAGIVGITAREELPLQIHVPDLLVK